MTIPETPIIRRAPGSVWVECPHCGRTHMHGDPGDGGLGHRTAHCTTTHLPNPGYVTTEEN